MVPESEITLEMNSQIKGHTKRWRDDGRARQPSGSN